MYCEQQSNIYTVVPRSKAKRGYIFDDNKKGSAFNPNNKTLRSFRHRLLNDSAIGFLFVQD